jgi:molybdopterin synthase catalytic subunit
MRPTEPRNQDQAKQGAPQEHQDRHPRIDVELQEEPIAMEASYAADLLGSETGALVEFRGIVRALEQGQPIRALRFEAYNSMAEKTMLAIAGELAQSWTCQGVVVRHRLGLVSVGEAAIYVGVWAVHRQQAFGCLSAFMDRLKQDVPIWKLPAAEGPVAPAKI